MQLLGAMHAFTRPEGRPEDAPQDGSRLEQALAQGRRAAFTALEAQKAAGVASVPSGVADETFRPGVTAKALGNLEEQRKKYKENNFVIYTEDFFDKATFAAIQEEVKRLWKSQDIEANCNLDGTNRLGGYVLDHLPRDSSLYSLIYGNEDFRRWVSEVNGEGSMWPSDFPIEVREYGVNSKGMQCHSDLQMYAVQKRDLEFAFTVDNFSRCNVTYRDAAEKVHTVHTRANSVMMVRVDAARHCVSATEGGHRTILKFIYVGDYRKSRDFWLYTANECAESNPNVQVVQQRRDDGEEYVGPRGASIAEL